MRDRLRWLAVPPALALLLMFGPWRAAPPSETPAERTAPAAVPPRPALGTASPLPDVTQVVCTVGGVCLLGVAVVFALARARRRPHAGSGVIALRQSVRLSGRHALHAVQFDDRLLLVGECEGSLRVLHTGEDPELAPARPLAASEPEEGAVLKDMVLPYPERAPASGRDASRPAGRAAPARGLATFKTLLGKAHAEA
jgi:hypothetical protein